MIRVNFLKQLSLNILKECKITFLQKLLKIYKKNLKSKKTGIKSNLIQKIFLYKHKTLSLSVHLFGVKIKFFLNYFSYA